MVKLRCGEIPKKKGLVGMKPNSEKVFKVVDCDKFIIYKVNPNKLKEFNSLVRDRKYFLSPTQPEIIFKGTSKYNWFIGTFGEYIECTKNEVKA